MKQIIIEVPDDWHKTYMMWLLDQQDRFLKGHLSPEDYNSFHEWADVALGYIVFQPTKKELRDRMDQILDSHGIRDTVGRESITNNAKIKAG